MIGSLRVPLLGLPALALVLAASAQAQLQTPVQAPSLAQPRVPAPLTPLGSSVYPGALEFDTRNADLAPLALFESLVLTGWPVPGGVAVELELTQVRPNFSNARLVVDGADRPLDRGDQTLWKGQVRGEAPGSAWLAFSSLGTYGWYEVAGELYHVSSFAKAGNDWSNAGLRIYSETLQLGVPGINPRVIDCQTDALTSGNAPGGPASPTNGAPLPLGGQQVLEMRIAVETDFQYFSHWGNLPAATNFLTQLLGAVGDRFLEQVDLMVTYPYIGMYTSNDDPWTAQSNGAGAMLAQFRQTWAGNIPEGAHLGHFLSGQGLGGGVAHLDVLCSQNWGFGVSGGINGGVNFPVDQGGDTWDFVVIAHEIGHQVGTTHTHNYNPPIDNCGNGGPCSSSGTIMSYCHTCGGGMNNITTYFHPTVVANMRADAVQSCIPVYVPPCTEEGFEPNDSCGAQATLIGVGALDGLRIVAGNPDWFEVPVAAGETLEFSVASDPAEGDVDVWLWDEQCGTVVDAGADVGATEVVRYTNLDTGTRSVFLEVWLDDSTPCNLYDLAIAAVPDPCTPTQDPFPGNGTCDAAAVLTPGLFSGLGVVVGTPDHFEVCVGPGSTLTLGAQYEEGFGDLRITLFDGEACSGTVLATSTAISMAEQLNWVNPSPDMPRRVTARVEVEPGSFHPCVRFSLAAAFFAGDCDAPPPPGPVGALTCTPANANSTGQAGAISGFGQAEVELQDLTLTAGSLPPNQFGFFLVSATPGFAANPGGSQGNLCLAGDVGRYQDEVASSGPGGSFSLAIDLTSLPTNPPQPVQAGQTWYFQAWYRDVVGGTPVSNFTDSLEVLFE